MSLIQAPQGESITVVRVAADEKTRKHLQDLGIVSGAQLTPLSFSDGSMIVCVRDSRIAVNRDIAENIIVRKSFVFA
ncbi:MAG: ferrous iron transport protein A [Clostridia bacterium]|jgi:ferrous iron transport protein A|nr:ferrous iron transport protein A [Clostridia bacterium]MCI9459568.1 ferrous iron transport protein A [Clostridia bacterium]